jgi:hypothetical protein
MEEGMTKTKIIESIRSERGSLDTVLGRLSETQMTGPAIESDWTVKDILAHIADWEQRMVRWTEESLRGEVPERPAPGMTWDDLDRLNEQIFASNRDKPLNDVLAEFHRSFQRALTTVEALAEADLIDPKRFEWRQGDPLWHMVAANTWWHYKEHRETIENWLKEST